MSEHNGDRTGKMRIPQMIPVIVEAEARQEMHTTPDGDTTATSSGRIVQKAARQVRDWKVILGGVLGLLAGGAWGATHFAKQKDVDANKADLQSTQQDVAVLKSQVPILKDDDDKLDSKIDRLDDKIDLVLERLPAPKQ